MIDALKVLGINAVELTHALSKLPSCVIGHPAISMTASVETFAYLIEQV
jgi:hypothetical protein